MATLIDALIVTLGLDATGFKKGQAETDEALKKTKENAVKHGKEIEAKAKAATEGFRQMKNQVMGLVGAFVSASGIKSFVERVNAADAGTNRLATSLGIATEDLSAWQKVASKFGGSAADMDGAFLNIDRIVRGLAKGVISSEDQMGLGMLLGSRMPAFLSTATTITEKVKMIQKAVAEGMDLQKTRTWMEMAGFTPTTVTVMREMGSRVESLLEEQRQLNIASKRDGELAAERTAAWNKLGDALERVGKIILNSPLLNLTEKIEAAAKKISDWTSNPGGIWPDVKEHLMKPPEPGAGKIFGPGKGLDTMFFNWLRDYGTPASKKANPASAGKAGGLSLNATPVDIMRWELDTYAVGARTPAERAALQRSIDRGNPTYKDYWQPRGAETLNRASNVRPAGAAMAKTEVSIGALTVITQATDATGIARDLGAAIRANYSLATQAEFGAR